VAKHTALDVARFMKVQLDKEHFMPLNWIVYEVIERFGEEFTYTNDNGNPAFNRDVLVAFRRITPDAVWERGSQQWRKRERYDGKGRLAE
jgi:hypothetical protein